MRRPPARPVIAGLLIALTVSGCSRQGDEPRAERPSGAPTPTASPNAPASAQTLVDQLLTDDVQPAPLKTVTGTITVNQTRVPVTVDVLEVRAAKTSTTLRWRLRSSTADRVQTFGSSMSRTGLQDTRGIRLQSPDLVLQPYTYATEQGGTFELAKDAFCACSKLPFNVGPAGVLMYAVLPPLAGMPSVVDVLLPGFSPATAVPVTR